MITIVGGDKYGADIKGGKCPCQTTAQKYLYFRVPAHLSLCWVRAPH